MAIRATANSKISIGTTAVKTDATGYAADTYTLISNVNDLGQAGSEAEILTRKWVDKAYVGKLKGIRDNGSMTLVVDRDSADAGYQSLIAAEKTDNAYNFKVELNDKPVAGASPKNSIFYFSAIVASAKNTFGGADDVPSTSFELAISGAMIEVAASAT